MSEVPRRSMAHHCPHCGEPCSCAAGHEELVECSHGCEEKLEDVCPDCLDPACDGWCRDAVLNEYGVDPYDAGF